MQSVQWNMENVVQGDVQQSVWCVSCTTIITSVSLRRGSTKHDGKFVHVVGEFMPEK